MELSRDAMFFALAYLRTPKNRLSFGGHGAEMQITARARKALDELLAAGFAEPDTPDTSIQGREYYRGAGDILPILRDAKIDPFGNEGKWTSFEKVRQ